LWFRGGQNVVKCMVKRGVSMVLYLARNLRQILKIYFAGCRPGGGRYTLDGRLPWLDARG